MNTRAGIRGGMAAVMALGAVLARANIVCDKFFVTPVDKNEYRMLTFVPLSAASATAGEQQADSELLALNLRNKLRKFAKGVRDRTGESADTSMVLQPYVCNSVGAITSRQDVDMLVDRNAIGAFWSDAAQPAVNITFLVPTYTSMRNLPDPGQSAVSVEFTLPDGNPVAQWGAALNLDRPPFSGVFAFGVGMAYRQTQRFVAAKYSLCNSKVLITGYLKDVPDADSVEVLKDILQRLDTNIVEVSRILAESGTEEPDAVRAMCAGVNAQR